MFDPLSNRIFPCLVEQRHDGDLVRSKTESHCIAPFDVARFATRLWWSRKSQSVCRDAAGAVELGNCFHAAGALQYARRGTVYT